MTTIILRNGDCVEVMRTLADGSVGAIVSDPPYGLRFMGKAFDDLGDGASQREWHRGWITEAYRVLKPGGMIKAFGGTRTFHHLGAVMREAGFLDIRLEAWNYGSGFPKSMNIGKQIDRSADYQLRAKVRRAAVQAVEGAGLTLPGNSRWDWTSGEHAPGDKWWAEFQAWLPGLSDEDRERVEGALLAVVRKSEGWFTSRDIYEVRAPETNAAKVWDGWGTALKPSWEPVLVGRKPE